MLPVALSSLALEPSQLSLEILVLPMELLNRDKEFLDVVALGSDLLQKREFTLLNLGKALRGEFVIVVLVHFYDWDAEVYDQFSSIRASATSVGRLNHRELY
jgi:hypothetical protein